MLSLVRSLERQLNRTSVWIDVLMVITIVLLTLIAPKIDPTLELRPKAVISMEWNDESLSDIDLHLLTPTGSHVSYQNKDPHNGIEVLVRDDLGGATLQNGDKVSVNEERIELFELEDGKYTVFIRMFSKRTDGIHDVSVRLTSLYPYSVEADTNEQLVQLKQTINCFSFRVINGDIVDVDYDDIRKLQ